MDISSVVKQSEKCTYTSCYCEENIWKLCQMVKEACSPTELKRCYAVFISNRNKQIPLWHQKASTNDERSVVWDYHVIMMYASPDGSLVYDLDTELAFPCSFFEYVNAGIGDESLLKKQYWRMFRVIDAENYLSRFASDRTHMLREDGTWLSPAPSYPPIRTTECANNLQSFISMEESNEFGTVLDLEDFRQRFFKS